LGKERRERAITEASAGGEGRAEWRRRLINRSIEDEDFRQRLLDAPKETLEQELGIQVPESMEVRVVEESADTIYLVLPSASAVDEGVEISDQELEQVAGGGDTIDVPGACEPGCNCSSTTSD
jgi:hypothetical protein